MSDRLEIHVAGIPHGRPRPRARAMKVGGKWIAQVYQPKGRPGSDDEKAWAKANAWFKAIGRACFQRMPATPWSGPISITIDAYFPRPERLLKKSSPDGPIRHTAKPDRDNVDKAVLDALGEMGLFAGDHLVCDGPVRKWYVARGCAPGVVIVAERISELDPRDTLTGERP